VQTARVSNVLYAPAKNAPPSNDLFASIARPYDLLNDLQSFGLHRPGNAASSGSPSSTGKSRARFMLRTGDIALALARQGAETTGLDFSPQSAGSGEKEK